MTRTPRSRRPASLVAAASAAALLGALLPVTLVAAPAQAANGCLNEAPTNVGPFPLVQPGEKCDDQVPPVATLESVSPQPNAAGFVRSGTITFTYRGAHTDADTDRIGFECKFWPFDTDGDGELEPQERTEPAQWTACGEGAGAPVQQKYEGLPDSAAVAYTFKVRAFDAVDRPIVATDPPGTGLFPGTPAETDLPDEQQTPVTTSFRVDTRPPVPRILNVPFDPLTPSLPMMTTDSPTFRLAAADGNVAFSCDIDGRDFPCAAGDTTFRRLGAGTKTLTVDATDQAGNPSTAPATTTFTVPADLELPAGGKWRETVSPRAFGGSYIETTAFGAKFAVEGTNVREVRLIATKRPEAGILRYKVPGNPNWAKVKLNSSRIERGAVLVLRNPSSKSFTGTMKFKTMSRGKLIEVDAIMLR